MRPRVILDRQVSKDSWIKVAESDPIATDFTDELFGAEIAWIDANGGAYFLDKTGPRDLRLTLYFTDGRAYQAFGATFLSTSFRLSKKRRKRIPARVFDRWKGELRWLNENCRDFLVENHLTDHDTLTVTFEHDADVVAWKLIRDPAKNG